ncbi:MAG: phosphotransferase [Patescibacteria group bacterium]
MLSKQYLSSDILDNILQPFTLAEITKIEPVATSGNIAYKIETKNGAYFFRLCPTGPRWRSSEEIAAEIELLDYLYQHKLPVLPALSDKNGQRIISWQGQYGYLRKFVDAQEKLDTGIGEIEKFGSMIGSLHELLQNFKTINKREHIFNPAHTKEYFFTNKNKILQSDFPDSKKFVDKFEQEICSLEFPDDLPAGLIHEDLGRRHVLWCNDEITAVIDFDRCYFGKFIWDLGQAARGWCFSRDWHSWQAENFIALLKGYQTKRVLTDLEKEYLPMAIRFAILERALSFCLRFIDVTQDEEDARFAKQSLFSQLEIIKQIKTAA